MEIKANPVADALANLPPESMLTYAVLLGRQLRKDDPYALGAQIANLSVRGCLSISEAAEAGPDMPGAALHIDTSGRSPATLADMFNEERVFTALLEDIPATGTSHDVALRTLTGNKAFTTGIQTLWKRVVMMHHANYTKDNPLYNADPTRSIMWQRIIRVIGYLIAAGSVYAEPGWQGVAAGVAVVLATHEVPERLAMTTAGRAVTRSVMNVQKQMLRTVESDAVDIGAVGIYEGALPFALLFGGELRQKWPPFLSRHYTDYPAWLVPAQPEPTPVLRQAHIGAMLRALSRLDLPAGRPAADSA